MPEYNIVISKKILKKIDRYKDTLIEGKNIGYLMRNGIQDKEVSSLKRTDILNLLMNTKLPQIFAESEVYGNGDDWTLEELSLLGDINIVSRVEIYDSGRHQSPAIHEFPIGGTLMFTPGALLRNDIGFTPADEPEVTQDGKFYEERYYGLYERRLLPLFRYASDYEERRGRNAFITIPGIGCGQFSGSYTGLSEVLKQVLVRMLQKHSEDLKGISCVYFDPYSSGVNEDIQIDHIQFRVRPLTVEGNELFTQLNRPHDYRSKPGEFADCELYSFVAWDHVSWPGNDFYLGSRVTDDGVKAAATNVLKKMTGVNGMYCEETYRYMPPQNYSNWKQLIEDKKLRITASNNIKIY